MVGVMCGESAGKAIEVLMTNERERQTYYGAVNFSSREFHLQTFSGGNGERDDHLSSWKTKTFLHHD